jgi:hypothetical protein
MEEWTNRMGWIGFWEKNYLRLMVRENLKHAAPLKNPSIGNIKSKQEVAGNGKSRKQNPNPAA